MLDRRKHKRFKTRLLMTTIYRDETNKIVSEESIFSEDIGAGGVRILFPHGLPKGKCLDLKVFLFADPIYLPAQGRVIWSSRKEGLELRTKNQNDKSSAAVYWIGIEFVNIDAFTRERIFHWLKKEFNVKEI